MTSIPAATPPAGMIAVGNTPGVFVAKAPVVAAPGPAPVVTPTIRTNGVEVPVAPAPTAPVTPTAGQVYKDFTAPAPSGTDEADAAASYKAANPVDENAIKSSVLSQFQNEIDATNAIYADQIATAKQQGLSSLGSGVASEARAGVVGSDFGRADQSKITDQNNAILSTIEQKQAAAIDAITNQANTDATNEINAKLTAQQNGLDTYLKYLGDAATRKTTNTTTLANSFVTQGINPSTMDPAKLQTILNSYGITAGDLNAAYSSAKKTADTAAATSAADLASKKAATAASLASASKSTDPVSVQEYKYAVSSGYKGSYVDYQRDIAQKSTPTGSGNSFTLTAGQRNSLAGAGFSNDDVNAIENDIRTNGLDSVLNNPNSTAAQKAALNKALVTSSASSGA